MAWNHVPLKRGSQRKSTSRKVMPSLGPGRRVVGHVVTWRSHTAAVLLAAAASSRHTGPYNGVHGCFCFVHGFSSLSVDNTVSFRNKNLTID